MIAPERSNSINVTPQTAEPLHIAARRLVERAYRKPGKVFGKPDRSAQAFYSVGVWTIGSGDTYAVESDPIDATFTLARMWAQESR